jgi:hypothetical protein
MLNRMVELARETGDIRQNALVPDRLVFPAHILLGQPFRRRVHFPR